MKYGVTVPNFGAFGDLDVLRGLAKDAEDYGWDGFFLWDHINWSRAPMLDPWVALAAIAVATERIRIGTMVTPLPRRRPWIVARQAATLDHLSRGRVVLGVGLGFPPDTEYEDLGEEPDARIRAEKLDESLAIIDGLWSGAPFSFSGTHYTVNETVFLPRPLQQPRIPIWVAGMWPARAPFRRAARWDGAFPIRSDLGPLSVDDLRQIDAFIAAHRTATGPRDLVVGHALPDDDAQARDVISRYAAVGVTWWMESDQTPEEVRAKLRRRFLHPP
jgi:alkanesulfonate monooxygenase SsuD/methylene tetrahydromethanopterin reductase-like flavin-dependent oxidoreductase (luciferase family)